MTQAFVSLVVLIMVNIFISLCIAIFSFQCFTLNYQLGGINKTMINMPKTLFENSIPIIQDDNNFIPYFQKNILEKSVEEYLKISLHKYTNNYQISFYYYDAEDSFVCKSEYCSGVKVKLNCKIMYFFDYQKTMFYEIKDNRR